MLEVKFIWCGRVSGTQKPAPGMIAELWGGGGQRPIIVTVDNVQDSHRGNEDRYQLVLSTTDSRMQTSRQRNKHRVTCLVARQNHLFFLGKNIFEEDHEN